jgi:hypothetical protein
VKTKETTVKQALTAIFAAAALVVIIVPAAAARVDRSLPATHSHAKAAEVAKKSTNAGHVVKAASIFVPSVVICPEQAPGDSWGYCIAAPPENGVGTAGPDSSATSVTYNDGAGT